MKHIRKFENYRTKIKREEIIKESVLQVNDIYKVRSLVDIPQSLINAYVKKVKDTTGKNLRQFFGDVDIAEEVLKWVTLNNLDVDKIPAGALTGDAQSQAQPGQAAPQGQAQPGPAAPQAQAQMPQGQAQMPQGQAQAQAPQAQGQAQAPQAQGQVQVQTQAEPQAQGQGSPQAQAQPGAQDEFEEIGEEDEENEEENEELPL